MQNKPNLRKAKMKLSFYSAKYYEKERLCRRGENKPNQTQPVVSAVESTRSELACTEQGRSVEPILSASGGFKWSGFH
jgi:hypothetical protein